MIHDVAMTFSLPRPLRAHRYMRYAIYGGTHTEAEALATTLAPTATISNSAPCSLNSCSKATPLHPHGSLDCTCTLLDWYPEVWVIGEGCRWHGTTTKG